MYSEGASSLEKAARHTCMGASQLRPVNHTYHHVNASSCSQLRVQQEKMLLYVLLEVKIDPFSEDSLIVVDLKRKRIICTEIVSSEITLILYIALAVRNQAVD